MTKSASEWARLYTEQYGWSLVAIPAGRKGPTTPGWHQPERALSSPAAAAEYYERNPTHNMGLLHSASGTCALDVDDVELTKLIFSHLSIDYDAIMASAARIVGRPGRAKALFKAPASITGTHKIAWPVKDDLTKTSVIFELRAGSVQDVLPPSTHPDTGLPYSWAGVSAANLPDLPHQLRVIWENWERFRPQLADLCPWKRRAEITPAPLQRVKNLNSSVIDQYNEATSIFEALARYGYKQTALDRFLSPNSGSGIPGVHVFTDTNTAFSFHASDPFDGAHSFDPFELFRIYEHNGDVSKAVKAAAEALHITNDAEMHFDAELHAIGGNALASMRPKVEAPSGPLAHVPEHLLSVPGVLQDVVNYYTTTAAKDQPQFAVQAALAFGSVVMGRRWVTDQRNYSGLYFVNVGVTAAGKEHAKTVVEKLLEEAGLDKRIGPSGYTSASGVMSALIGQPTHIAIIDELGRVLQSTKAQGNYHKADAQTILMEVFGRQDSTLRPQGYSKMGLKADEAAELDKVVRHPSLTLLSMTTPSTLFETISSKYVTDGFLGRFIIVESHIGRDVSRIRRQVPPSDNLIQWAKMCATASAGTMDMDTADVPPTPVLIEFTPDCHPMLTEFDRLMMRQMDELERYGIEGMYGRTKEIAQRLALIVAVSKGEAEITTDSLQWAMDYVNFYAHQTVASLRGKLSDSPFEGACKAVFALISKAGLKGLTEGELSDSIPAFKGLKPIERKAVFENLAADYGIQGRNVNEGKRGRPKLAWFCPAD
jgi:hypothetical protein